MGVFQRAAAGFAWLLEPAGSIGGPRGGGTPASRGAELIRGLKRRGLPANSCQPGRTAWTERIKRASWLAATSSSYSPTRRSESLSKARCASRDVAHAGHGEARRPSSVNGLTGPLPAAFATGLRLAAHLLRSKGQLLGCRKLGALSLVSQKGGDFILVGRKRGRAEEPAGRAGHGSHTRFGEPLQFPQVPAERDAVLSGDHPSAGIMVRAHLGIHLT